MILVFFLKWTITDEKKKKNNNNNNNGDEQNKNDKFLASIIFF